MTCYPKSPHILFCTVPSWLGELDKINHVRVFLVSHVTKLLPGIRSVHVCCLCVLWTEPWVWVMSILTCLTFTNNMPSMLSHFQTKCISSSKHETQTLFWFYGQKSLIVCLSMVRDWIVWEALSLKIFQFSLSFISDLTMEHEQSICHQTNCEWW